MEYLSEIRLVSLNSLIEGNMPEIITQQMVADKIKKDITLEGLEKFGLFDTATPNFSHYYPEVKAEDLTPKDEDFAYPVFRSLSETTVHKNWNPVDFAKKDVLKNSMNLLLGMTVYPNHEAVVGNELGAVKDVFWQESFQQDKFKIPAGINSRLKIDGKSNPKIVRGLTMDPPSIHSSSVTVRFLWEKSHQSMSEDEFFKNLASYDKDGNQVKRIATKVNSYPEISFVPHGADQFAQIVDKNGKINNPQYASTVYNSEASGNDRKKQKIFVFNFKSDLVANSDEIRNTIPDDSNISNNETTTMKKETLIMLGMILGFAEKDIPTEESKYDEFAKSKVTSLKEEADKVTNLTTERDSFKQKYEAIKDADQVAELQEFKNNALTTARKSVVESYKKLKGDKAEEAHITNLNKMNSESLAVLGAEYETQLNAKYPLSCNSCHSTDVTRASSVVTDTTETENTEIKKKEPGTVVDLVRNKIKATGDLSFFEAAK